MAESQEILFVVKADNKQAVDALTAVQASMDGVTTQTRKLASSTQNSNMLLMSTGRIVQDLPYGFMAVGNNITFMTEQMMYMRGQGMSTKEMLIGMGKSLMGPMGVVFAISTLTTVLTYLSMQTRSTKDEVDQLTKSLQEMIKVETPKGAFNVKPEDIPKAIALLKEEIRLTKEFAGSWIKENPRSAELETLNNAVDVLEKASQKEKERLRIVGLLSKAGLTYTEELKKQVKEIQDFYSYINKIMDAEKIDEPKALGDAKYDRFALGSGSAELTRGGGGAMMAGFSRAYADNIKMITTLTISSADILRSEFKQAWEDIFGEANSLFEKLIANFANQLMNLGLQQLAGGFLNFLFPGAGAASGALAGSPQIINVQLGDETLARAVVKGNNTAQRLRLN